MAVTYFQKLS